jgi:hypothetical protein
MEADPKHTPAAEHGRPAAGSGGADGDDHDRSLIVERLGWTPEQRLDANTAFVRFYLTARPDGPISPTSDDRA